MVACMLLDGIVTFESSHDEARMQDPKVLARASGSPRSVIGAAEGHAEPAGDRDITMKDGRKLRHHTQACAHRAKPMTRAEVDEKSITLAPILGKSGPASSATRCGRWRR